MGSFSLLLRNYVSTYNYISSLQFLGNEYIKRFYCNCTNAAVWLGTSAPLRLSWACSGVWWQGNTLLLSVFRWRRKSLISLFFFYCCTGWWWAAQCTLVNQLSFSGSPTQWALNSVLHFSQFTRLYTGVDALHVGWWWALYIANHCMGDIHPCTEGDTLPTDDKFCRNEH